LSKKINIFGDDDVIKFLRLEKEVPHLLSNLRDLYEMNRLGNTYESKSPASASSQNKRFLNQNLLSLVGDIQNMTG
jgi:hypothetical protein